jgi:hypothetical protein
MSMKNSNDTIWNRNRDLPYLTPITDDPLPFTKTNQLTFYRQIIIIRSSLWSKTKTVTAVHMNMCTGTQLQLCTWTYVQAHSYSCAHEHMYRHIVTAVHMNICTGTELQLCTWTYVQAQSYSCTHEHMYRHTVTDVHMNICTGTQLQLRPIPCRPHAHQILRPLPAPHTRKIERARYMPCNFKHPATRFGTKCLSSDISLTL